MGRAKQNAGRMGSTVRGGAMTEHKTETLMQRVDRLERQNRLFKRIGGFALGAIAAVVLMGQALPSKVAKLVEAEKFLVRDTAGRPRATLGLLPDGSPSLNLIDQDGNIRMAVGMKSEGSPSLNLYDKTQTNRAVLATLPDGSPALVLFSKSGETRALLGSNFPIRMDHEEIETRPPSSLLLFDTTGKVIWRAP